MPDRANAATAGSTALHAEAGAQRGFAQRHDGPAADFVESQCQSDRDCRLSDAGFGGRDGCHEDEFALLLSDEVQGELGDVLAVVFQLGSGNFHRGCHFVDGLQRNAVGDFQVSFHRRYNIIGRG